MNVLEEHAVDYQDGYLSIWASSIDIIRSSQNLPFIYSCHKKVAQDVDFLSALMYKIHLMHAEWVFSDELTFMTFSIVRGQSVPNCNPEPRLCNIKWWKFTGRRSLTLCRVRLVCLCLCLIGILVRDTKPVFMDGTNPHLLQRGVQFQCFYILYITFLSILAKNWI
jgi:hypothetical protein